jgi:hypothetical protein
VDWIRVRGDDIKAIGDLPRIDLIMQRVVALDPQYRAGTGHLYLALLAMYAQEDAETIGAHFVPALAAAGKRNLMPHVLHALWLRDSGKPDTARTLLGKLVADGLPGATDYALMNRLALDKAQHALDNM